jgi:hypothetical protein
LDPLYFSTLAKACQTATNPEDLRHTAALVRLLRDQAAEMLFALLAASVQAPKGVALWMLKYRNEDIAEIIDALSSPTPILTASGRRSVSWRGLVEELTSGCEAQEPASLEEYRTSAIGFMRRLWSAYSDPLGKREYNSVKHGLRIRPGMATLRIAPERSSGEVHAESQSTVLSAYGGTFVTDEPIDPQKVHFRLVQHHRSWDASTLALQVELVSALINNVVCYLLAMNGETELGSWRIPDDGAVWTRCWKSAGSLHGFNFSTKIELNEIRCLTREELIVWCECGPPVQPAEQSKDTGTSQ